MDKTLLQNAMDLLDEAIDTIETNNLGSDNRYIELQRAIDIIENLITE